MEKIVFTPAEKKRRKQYKIELEVSLLHAKKDLQYWEATPKGLEGSAFNIFKCRKFVADIEREIATL